ncbi:MAG: HAD family hydrolase [Congregibacter sp.]
MSHPGAALRAVIFDLDGTLVDTADDFVPAVQQLQRELGAAPLAASRIRSSVSNGSRALVKLALGLEESQQEFEPARLRLLELYAGVLGQFARPYPGMRELLGTLESLDIAWGIATNKPREYTLPLLHSLSLKAGSVICPEDVAEPKPHPESLHKACRDLGCATHEAVYIGDHIRDIEAGKRAGLYTIAAAYGYIEPGDSAEAWGADQIASSSTQLPSLLFFDT